MFHSCSQKQKTHVLSTTEAELTTAVECTKEIMYLRNLMNEIGYAQLTPTTLYADNKSLITLATQYSGSQKRVKHYLSKINFMIEQVNNGIMHLEYLQSQNQTADTLSKPLGPSSFIPFRNEQMGPQRYNT